ncbi:DNA repair protein RadA [Actinoallomurus rhizosphaericola]|uniref:DNA repair protein RadA n=1 Tax=Actinoallomurus rhizosphaericola TaxID=2952536 RepID=UPI0020900806|nr:DNA repair protein RadA [Actinoallomurus rhizosphaericola]MCO5994443.1 DNA repair protein RadA [Actinoallomurus rhizosphaericola]
MAKSVKQAYRCTECGWQTSKWVGRCGECQAWGTVDVAGAAKPARVVTPGPVSAPARPIGQVDVQAAQTAATGLDELDRVLGGGLVPGAVLLLAGEPGIGKSTLLLEVAALHADRGTALYVTGEESAEQVRLRADRIGAIADRLYLAAETDLAAVLGQIDSVAPELVVVDSIQTIGSAEIDGAAGGVSQVREVAANLIRVAKERGITTVVVGHVTKDGSIAGPRVLEHLVDVVLYFEGDRHSRLRMIRAVKNRYGPTDELGCFDLSEMGIIGLADPSGLFLTRQEKPAPGTCVTVTLEGRRPLVAEVQALVAPSPLANPRRMTSGLDSARIAMMLAVLQRRCRIKLHDRDVYAATVGGVRLSEPSVDLAVALAVTGAANDSALPSDLVAFGEVGLAGEVRGVQAAKRRLAEASRLGYRRAIVPGGSIDPTSGRTSGTIVTDEGMQVTEVDDVWTALALAFATAAADA